MISFNLYVNSEATDISEQRGKKVRRLSLSDIKNYYKGIETKYVIMPHR